MSSAQAAVFERENGELNSVEMLRAQMRCGYLLTLAVCSLAKTGCIRGDCQDGLGTCEAVCLQQQFD